MFLGPSAPTNIRISQIQSTQFTVNWDAVSGLTDFRFQIGYGINSWQSSALVPISDNQRVINNLQSNTEYVVKVRLQKLNSNAEIVSNWSPTVRQETGECLLNHKNILSIYYFVYHC